MNATPKSVHTAMSRWALITALEMPWIGGSVTDHIDALPVTKVGTIKMEQITKSTSELRFITMLLANSAVMKKASVNTNPTVGKWFKIMWTCDHACGVLLFSTPSRSSW